MGGYFPSGGSSGGGGGSVTSVSLTPANGFGGSVATATTTPAITLTTTVTGLLKGNGTAVSAATAGTDYLVSLTGPYVVSVVSTSQTMTANQVYVVSSGSPALTLPGSPASGNWITVKNKGTGAPSITGTIDGQTNPAVAPQYVSQTAVYDGTNWNFV